VDNLQRASTLSKFTINLPSLLEKSNIPYKFLANKATNKVKDPFREKTRTILKNNHPKLSQGRYPNLWTHMRFSCLKYRLPKTQRSRTAQASKNERLFKINISLYANYSHLKSNLVSSRKVSEEQQTQ